MKQILLVGEPMSLFIAKQLGAFEEVNEYSLAVAGAEFNAAVGLSRLGQAVTYVTRLGSDPFGRRIVREMKKNGLDTSRILYSDERPTGFMFKSKVLEGDPAIFYFRKGSAASTFNTEDVLSLKLDDFDALHITGITPALSQCTRQAAETLFRRTRERGMFVSFDPNLRPQLWGSVDEMRACINRFAFDSDLFLPGIKEAAALSGLETPEEITRFYQSRGVGTVVIKLGAEGAYYASADESGYIAGFPVKEVVDTVGAGDGFAAGVLSGLRDGLSTAEAVRRGNAVGAIQVMSVGDNDGLPTMEELQDFMAGKVHWRKV